MLQPLLVAQVVVDGPGAVIAAVVLQVFPGVGDHATIAEVINPIADVVERLSADAQFFTELADRLSGNDRIELSDAFA